MRPSKRFFYHLFGRDMRKSDIADVGMDLSSADFKNYSFFQTREYVAVDIDSDRLARGMKRWEGHSGGPKIRSICCDMREIESHADFASVDFLVSTHTLGHLNESDRLPMLKRMINLVRPGGTLLLQCNESGEINRQNVEDLLRESFARVVIREYRNRYSKKYEDSLVDSQGQFVSPSGALGKLRHQMHSRLLLACEHLNWFGPTDHLYCFASQRRETGSAL